MNIAYPKPHPPYPAPSHTAIHKLKTAERKRRQLHFHKALAHDEDSHVEEKPFKLLLKALSDHAPADFNAIQLAAADARRLVNPQCGLAADREVAAGFYFRLPPPPEQASCEETTAAELIELYWMALLRDVPFDKFTDPTYAARVQAAVDELCTLKLYAKRGTDRAPVYEPRSLTAQNVFRGGDWWVPDGGKAPQHIGPYISQFLYLNVPYGALIFDQRQRRSVVGDQDPVLGVPPYMTTWADWFAVQDGAPVGKDARPVPEADARYIQNMADLARYVHLDKLYQAYLDACFILLGGKAKKGKGSPYGMVPCGIGRGAAPHAATDPWAPNFPAEEGFGTFGDPHILATVCEVSTRALKAVWYQKWFVHLRGRPEAYAGLVHRARANEHDPASAVAALGGALPIFSASAGTDAVFAANGTSYLLPMAFPEGSPTHPAYGAGHACVAGACVTVLKAFFDDSQKLSELYDIQGNPLVPQVPNGAGTALVDYIGPNAADFTVGGELDKLASNIAIGRNMAGVHWRTDYTQSVLLGQRVAISMLYHQRRDYHERPWCFHFTTFAGHHVKIDQFGVHLKEKEVDADYTTILDGDDDLSPEYEAKRLERIS